MPNEFDPKLEAMLDAELKKLPSVPAPSRLVPNVLAAIAARAGLPWWQRSWWDWPLTAKAAFLLMGMAIAGAFGGGSLFLGDGAAGYSAQVAERFDALRFLWDMLAPVVDAAWLVWEKTAGPFWWYAAIAAFALYLACLGAGTACYRFALKRI